MKSDILFGLSFISFFMLTIWCTFWFGNYLFNGQFWVNEVPMFARYTNVCLMIWIPTVIITIKEHRSKR